MSAKGGGSFKPEMNRAVQSRRYGCIMAAYKIKYILFLYNI